MRTLLLILVFSFSVAAQSVPACTVVLADLPPLRGLTLRAARADVSTKFPYLTGGPAVFVQELKQDNIHEVMVEFFDDRLSAIGVSYQKIPFLSPSDFADSISASFRLPRRSWVIVAPSLAVITCKDFGVVLDIHNKSLMLSDTVAAAAKRARDSKTFKP